MVISKRGAALAVGLALLVGPVGGARAGNATELARKHNAEAEKLFNLGMFREAAAAYQRAYVAKPVPDFLYNLGQCHKRLGTLADLERAIFFFESFVNNAPPTPLRDEVESQIAKLKREIEARRAVAAHRPIYKRWWFWTLIGAAVAGAAVGTALALRPQDQEPVRGSIGDPSPLQLPLRGWR